MLESGPMTSLSDAIDDILFRLLEGKGDYAGLVNVTNESACDDGVDRTRALWACHTSAAISPTATLMPICSLPSVVMRVSPIVVCPGGSRRRPVIES